MGRGKRKRYGVGNKERVGRGEKKKREVSREREGGALGKEKERGE